MADKTWITLSKNGVVDKVFEQNGKPESLQMTNLDANTQYVAQAGLESDGLQSLALQTATFTTLQAGAMTLTLVSCVRSGMNYVATYSYTSTYAPSAAILTRWNSWTYQGVIDSNNHTVTFTMDDLNGGSAQRIQARLDDIYGGSVLSETTTFTVDYAINPLTIRNISDTGMYVTFTPIGSPSTLPDLKRYAEGGWTDIGLSTDNPTNFYVAANSTVVLGGDNPNGFNRSSGVGFKITASKNHKIQGNIMSLISKTNYASITDIPAYSFHHLFQGDTNLTSALNATFGDVVNHRSGIVSDYALENMFDGCTSLEYPPDMSKFGYIGLFCMHYTFANCTNLRRAADLSHVTDVNRWALLCCYEKCTRLATGSDLRRVARNEDDYMKWIYLDCSSLNTAYFTSNASSSGAYGWLSGCAATGTIYAPSDAVRDAIVGTSVVPSGWSVVVQAP